MMRYRLSFEMNTDTDPSQLLDLLTELAESLALEVDDEHTEDAAGEPVAIAPNAYDATVASID
jgi:hypothetical protein